MGKGKACAQCGHATVGAFVLVTYIIFFFQKCNNSTRQASSKVKRAWRNQGEAKIALNCPSEQALKELKVKAEQKGLIHYLVVDSGKTQLIPGTCTVLSIGPGES